MIAVVEIIADKIALYERFSCKGLDRRKGIVRVNWVAWANRRKIRNKRKDLRDLDGQNKIRLQVLISLNDLKTFLIQAKAFNILFNVFGEIRVIKGKFDYCLQVLGLVAGIVVFAIPYLARMNRITIFY